MYFGFENIMDLVFAMQSGYVCCGPSYFFYFQNNVCVGVKDKGN